MEYEKIIRHQLEILYGERSSILFQEINNLIQDFRLRHSDLRREYFHLSEKDVILITYGDQFRSAKYSPLQSLFDFLINILGDSVNRVHLLPFYPYSSDDGFSVLNYRQVDPELGTWEDIHQLSDKYQLMFDAVINHISKESSWFQSYIHDELPYKDYFIEVDPSSDISSIFRPRALPLIHPFETTYGKKYVWTTFSEDQIDLNFSNPQVLLEIIDLLLFYVDKGARLIRLDAVGYIWKKLGTSSLNLPQAHSIVKIIRAVLGLTAPNVGIITETNVPHDENIKYFGDPISNPDSDGATNSGDEAQMIYNFSLAPLVLHTFHSGDASLLANWVSTINVPYRNSTFFNFIASHDGFGVTPAKGLLSEKQIHDLVEKTKEHGGIVSYKSNSDGSESVYELNITLFDALNNPTEEDADIKIKRFMASQAIMLSMAGVPGIYIHSLLGSQNCKSCLDKTSRARSINREKFNLDQLKIQLTNLENHQTQILREYKRLLSVRRLQPAFNPAADQYVLDFEKGIFGLLRISINKNSKILCMINVSSQRKEVNVDLSISELADFGHVVDILSNQQFLPNNRHILINMEPYQARWLKSI